MQVYAHRVAPFDNRMYVIADTRGDAILIDPSQGEREALATARERGLKIIELINTHGHPDHVFANAALQAATGARLAIHRADAYRLDPGTAPRPRFINEFPRSVPDDLIEEGPLTYLAPTVAFRFAIGNLGIELAATRPLVGTDRHTVIGGLRVNYRLR